jgi:hypothetical protein
VDEDTTMLTTVARSLHKLEGACALCVGLRLLLLCRLHHHVDDLPSTTYIYT